MVSMDNTISDTLPPDLELFLNIIGIREKKSSHTKVVWPEEKENLTEVSMGWLPSYEGAVSYTHLTLPTSDLV